MASPLSFGDLIAISEAAWTLFQACQHAPDQVRDLGALCASISMAIKSCRPNDPSSSIRKALLSKESSEAIELLANRIEDSLHAVKQILGKYDDLDVPSLRNLHRRLIFGVFTVQDCNEIKRAMMDQVSTLTLLLQGENLTFQEEGYRIALRIGS